MHLVEFENPTSCHNNQRVVITWSSVFCGVPRSDHAIVTLNQSVLHMLPRISVKISQVQLSCLSFPVTNSSQCRVEKSEGLQVVSTYMIRTGL